MTHHPGRTILAFFTITGITLAIAYLNGGSVLGNVALAAALAFVAGYLCHATEEDLP